MATVTFTAKDSVLTGTATVTCYYTITETDDTLTFTANSVTVKVDSHRAWHNAYPEFGSWTGSKATIAANGSKSWTINKSVTTSKTHSSQLGSVTFTFNWKEDTDYPLFSYEQVTYTIPAKTSYSITLNANSGSGGATSLTKWHGESLDLTTGFTAPTRVGYRFEGWALSGDTVLDEYDVDEATTLYAVWTPVITGVSLDVRTLRVENGTSASESDDGDYCYGTVAYTVTGGASGNLALSIAADDSAVTFDSGTPVTLTKSADTTLTGTHIFRASNCDTDTKITFTVTASATNTSVSGEAPVTASQSDVLSVAYFPLDILGDNYVSQGQRPGHGLAIGLPAKKEGFAVGMDIFFQQWAGVIQMFAGSTPPAGWLLCDGSAVSRTEYNTLYAAIGDTWGAGDGSTTFNLPDLRGRAPIGAGTGSGLTARTLGEHTIGAETHTLTGPQSGIQAHSVAVAANWYISTYKGTRSTEVIGAIGGSGYEISQVKSGGSWSGQNSISVAAKNATQAHNNMQPSAVVNFIIHTGKVN